MNEVNDSDRPGRWIESSHHEWRDLILLDAELSTTARVFYLTLDTLSRIREEGADDPTMTEIRALLGCSENTLRDATKELVEAGLMTVKRRGRGRPNRYSLHPKSRPSDSEGLADSRPSDFEGPSRARVQRSRTSTTSQDQDQDHSEQPIPGAELAIPLPKAVKIEGRNLGYDALVAVCKLAEKSPRRREIPAALNGSAKNGTGIREQFWHEVLTKYEGEPPTTDPEKFEQGVAEAIVKRAALYVQVMRGASLTPLALQKWWSDLPAMRHDNADDLAARMRRKAEQLREEGK